MFFELTDKGMYLRCRPAYRMPIAGELSLAFQFWRSIHESFNPMKMIGIKCYVHPKTVKAMIPSGLYLDCLNSQRALQIKQRYEA